MGHFKLKESTIWFDGAPYNIINFGKRQYYRHGKKMLHREMWEKVNGPLSFDEEVHHIDGNSLNNSLDNLIKLTKEEHGKIHANENIQHSLENIKGAFQKWSMKKHYRMCIGCGKVFELRHPRGKYCSMACKDHDKYIRRKRLEGGI